ncbi:MAG: hypothetical protein AMS27_03620 [Bacteroides sp. SM23_62_1]|nr:MAG: hypothetical protein AMS27_03620 [Bacteroides sp. SM23_62_1]
MDTINYNNPDSGKKGGVVFLRTTMLSTLKDFYINEAGCELWLDQRSCAILKHGNQLFGFCEASEPDLCGILTFFYTDTKMVDHMYMKLHDRTDTPPVKNDKYRIYHFFAHDPEGRRIEFQVFLHALPEY